MNGRASCERRLEGRAPEVEGGGERGGGGGGGGAGFGIASLYSSRPTST